MDKKNNIIIALLVVIIGLLTVVIFVPHVSKNIALFMDKSPESNSVVVQSAVVTHTSQPIQGQVEYVEGTVEKRDSPADGWREVEGGEIIGVGAEVRTLQSSRAVVTFEDGSVVRLSENTQMRVENESDKIHIAFDKGRIFNKVVKDETRIYQVDVEGMQVRALGTAFTVENEEKPHVVVVESQVEIKKADGTVIGTIDEGEKSDLKETEIAKENVAPEDLEKSFLAWNIEEDKFEKEKITKKHTEEKVYKEKEVKKKIEEEQKKKEADKKEEEKKATNGSISLSGKSADGGVKLSWSLSGYAPHGFKVVRDANKNPTYPEDKAVYVDKNTRSYYWKSDADKKYYFRVCMYDGSGACSNYSNNVDVAGSGKSNYDEKDYADKISLSAKKKDGDRVKLEWSLSGGDAPKGFKILVDDDKNPKYPDHAWTYISDGDARSYTIEKGLKDGEDYHFRVCTYNGSGCDVYSDDEKVEL